MKNEMVFFELQNSTLWSSYENVGHLLENEFSLSHKEVKSLIKNQMEERFKTNGLTHRYIYGINILTPRERFKMKKAIKNTSAPCK